jgi:lipoprotein-anchoring transpeptidase ErfK/SrfK
LLLLGAGCLTLVVSSPAAAAQKRPAAKKPAAKSAVAKKPAPPAFDEKALQTQVALDRAGFSPGEIDGRPGTSTKRALEAFTKNGGTPDATSEAVVTYKITDEDAAGPFMPDLPEDMMEKAKLTALGYKNLNEALGERFHVSPALLKALNPQAKFAAGEEIRVPNVEAFTPSVSTAAAAPAKSEGAAAPAPKASAPTRAVPPAPAATATAPTPSAATPSASTPSPATPSAATPSAATPVTVTVHKSTSDLVVTDAEGKTVFYAPVTTGSEHDPLPIGDWKVNGVQRNPTFAYNPDLFWDADATHAKAKIPAGPNNPVGVVWVDISRPHYGLHGTPEPSTVGKTSSHGCVRLTNWDAQKLAALVKPGTKVVFAE